MTVTPSIENELTALFEGQRLEDPYSVWNRARETAPVIRLPSIVLVTRFDQVKALLSDEDRLSSEFFIRGTQAEKVRQSFSAEGQRMWQEMAEYDRDFLVRMQGEKHERVRRVAHRFFTAKRIRELTDAFQNITNDLIDEAAEQEVFDQKWLADELGLRVVSHIVGSPQTDREYLAGLIRIRGRYVGTTQEQRVREAYPATKEFDAYVRDVIIAEHRRNPGSNELVSAMLAAEDDEVISTQEFVVMVMSLFAGGVETTEILFTNGMLEMMRNRDQWERLCAEPALTESAVEELLRYVSPTQWGSRVAKKDFEWHGVEIPKEMTVYGSFAGANRDPRVFDDPDTLDLARDPQHLSLGFGPHFCLGAALIRSEARILLETLARRCPDLELAVDFDELRWEGGNPLFRTPWELPMRLGRMRAAA
jgi:cytochrome P450